MFCANCGNKLIDSDQFCPKCGNKVKDEKTEIDNDTIESIIRCPYCGSKHLHTDAKGFSIKKAAMGTVLIGPIGLLAGNIGSSKVKITCLKCGKAFKPSDAFIDDSGLPDEEIEQDIKTVRLQTTGDVLGILLAVIFCIAMLALWIFG